MAHELLLLKNNTLTNITPIIGTITRRSNKDELGEEISFDVAHSESKFIPDNPCDIGDMVILKNGEKEITRALIVDETRSGRSPIGYVAFDAAFYLNKSTMIKQFKKMRADQCIRNILKDFNVPIGHIPTIPVTIDQIYPDDTPIDIIRDILDRVRRQKRLKYLLEMRQGKLYIEPQDNLVIRAWFNFRNNEYRYDATGVITNPSRSRSINDMINSIQIVNNEDKFVLTKNDNEMMNKYGKLQKVVKLDQNEKLTAKQVAENELKELSKITEETSIELPGDDNVRAGRLLDLKEPVTGIKGRHLITEVTHTIHGRIHTMNLGLEVM